MKKLLYLLTILLLLPSCNRRIYVPVESVREVHDTVRIDTASRRADIIIRRDSVIVRDSVAVIINGDTIVREVWRWRERVREVHDTVRVATAASRDTSHSDTAKTAQVVEVEKPLSWWQRTQIWLGRAALTAAALAAAWWIFRRKYIKNN